MRILIVAPEQDRISGNWVSAMRFQHGLEQLRNEVMLASVAINDGFASVGDIKRFDPEAALLLHAYKSGKPWLNEPDLREIPFITMLTGTDINLGLEEEEQGPVIEQVISTSEYVILQNPLLAESFAALHPELAANLQTIKPGVCLGTADYNLRRQHDIGGENILFLCPAGLRPIKMQTELLYMFDEAIQPGHHLQLAFCGPVMDRDYGEALLAEIAKRPWAKYLGSIPPVAMASAMRQADVIVNNSLAEGISNSLLEAATLGIPILARDNPGNAAVVRHKCNGLLYRQTTEGIDCIRLLLDNANRSELSRPDSSYNVLNEATALNNIFKTTVKRHCK